jgi:Phytanoyl-CoA dioxygenase (PhyH)
VKLDFDRDGAARVPSAINPDDWITFLEPCAAAVAGVRLRGMPELRERLGLGSKPFELVKLWLGAQALPVRAILFNKTTDNNWPLGWHQDRTIAVAERHDVDGFGPWTTKQGILHVEPPFAIIEKMMTLRIHLDDVDADNAPLHVALGSHRLGRIPERDYESIVDECEVLTCHAGAGDIWVYSTPILHASEAARRPRQRRVLQVDYSSEALPPPLRWAGI